MNVNVIYSKRQHTRVTFSPLRVSCALRCMTPQSPLTQSVNTYLSPVEYEPDRKASPTVVMPDIKTIDPDSIFQNGQANELLSVARMAWYIDNTKIANGENIATEKPLIGDIELHAEGGQYNNKKNG